MRALRKSAAILFTVSVVATVPLVSAPAQDIDSLIAEMDHISEDATAKSEQVKQLEDDLKAAEDGLGAIEENARIATEAADQALARQREFQETVNRIAQAKYRGVVKDPVKQVIGSHNPQHAIDRSAYLTTLTLNTEKTVGALVDSTAEANEARNHARQSLEEARFKRNNLIAQQHKLEKEQEDLKARIEEIMNRVDSLSPQDRQRWVEKNGPIDYSIAGLLGTNESGMSALQAGMTKIGSPYGWGATGPDTFDCSGLVVWSYMQQGKVLPRTSQAQMAGGVPVSRADLQPGDVVGFFPGATHVGIYAGNNMILHASDYGIPVQVVSMDSMPFYGARRY